MWGILLWDSCTAVQLAFWANWSPLGLSMRVDLQLRYFYHVIYVRAYYLMGTVYQDVPVWHGSAQFVQNCPGFKLRVPNPDKYQYNTTMSWFSTLTTKLTSTTNIIILLYSFSANTKMFIVFCPTHLLAKPKINNAPRVWIQHWFVCVCVHVCQSINVALSGLLLARDACGCVWQNLSVCLTDSCHAEEKVGLLKPSRRLTLFFVKVLCTLSARVHLRARTVETATEKITLRWLNL